MKRFPVLLCVILLLAAGVPAFSQSPIQLALFNPVQIVPENQSVSGLRFSLLYGKNTHVTGLDIGLVNFSSSGLSEGVQWGLVGFNEGSFLGGQMNAVSITKGNVEGVQFGIYNSGGHVSGLQIGFINQTATMKGLQIGLINIIQKGAGLSPVLPIINWSF